MSSLSPLRVAVVLCACLGSLHSIATGQTTVETGSIQGTITDPAGAVIAGAKVTITGQATGQTLAATTSSSGTYSSGSLIPGQYRVTVQQSGFQTLEIAVTVQVGQAANASGKLTLGTSSQVVEVAASGVQVNTEQAIVQGVITAQQIDALPINGRNFLDLAQLEPGVQIQDGTNFDPTKVGYSSISFGGRFGRTARISVDGVDVSDETVGTTTQDIPASGIQEFELSQSNLDLSNDLTSSGAVNVITRSGSNEFHGEAFYLIRDSRWGADLPHPQGLDAPYQRNQFGARLGGYLIKNKLFFFTDYERTKQDEFIPIQYPAPFQSFSGGFPSPFRENLPMGRLDWQATSNLRMFYRFNYFDTLAEATFFSSSLSPYKSKNYTRSHVAGADFNTGSFTHSLRFEQLKFQNNLSDATIGSSLPLANLGVTLNVNDGPQTGPNLLVPQATPQLDRQVKYDGGKPLGKHFLRFGVNYNWIEVSGFASFFGLAPEIETNLSPGDAATAAAGPYPGGAGNPLNYPVEVIIAGNGQGYSTEKPALGYPAGRLGPDNRFAFYVGDTWKILPNLTFNYGLRYVRDTGRTDSDLPGIPELNSLIPGDGNAVHQPNLNFAPQLGLAWDPTKNGKTVIRLGAGLFYENVIYNNVLFDRPLRLSSGAFFQSGVACVFGQTIPVNIPGGTTSIDPSLCSEDIGQAAAGIAAFQKAYQGATPFNLTAPNPNYILTQIANGVSPALGLFAPNYKTPRSLQMNAGIQREIAKGSVISIDYVRNVETHTLLGIDTNHVGDAKYFNKAAAQSAIAATLSQFGVSTINQAIAAGATMADFAGNGLTSPAIDFGGVCPFTYGCAFPGINANAPELLELEPIGRSVYNALDVKFTQNIATNMRTLKRVNLQASYSLSRFVNPGGSSPTSPSASDQDFVLQALDFDKPNGYSGPSLLDRTNQFSFGGFFDLPGGFRSSVIAHFYSGLPSSLVVPNTGDGAGEIFRTDFTGDGTVQDLLPGTNVGAFNRSISTGGLASALQNYNSTVANQPTPAGQVLISSGLFTLSQLQALGGVAPTVALPPSGEVGIGGLRTIDMGLSWIHKFGERLSIEPSATFFNLPNFANFDLPPNIISGLLTGAPGSLNGTTSANRITNRVGVGTGVFALAAPRAIEFGMRISF